MRVSRSDPRRFGRARQLPDQVGAQLQVGGSISSAVTSEDRAGELVGAAGGGGGSPVAQLDDRADERRRRYAHKHGRCIASVAAARAHYDEFTAFLQKDHSTAAVKYAAGQAYDNMDKLFTTGMFKEKASGEFQTWVSPCAIGGRQVVVEGRLGKRAEKELKGSEWEGSLKPPVVKTMVSARAQDAQSKPMEVDSLHAIKGAVTVLRDTGRYVEQLQDKFDDTIARSEALEADFKKLEQEKSGEKPAGYYNAIIANVRLHVLVVTKLRELTNLTIFHYRDVVKNLDLLNKALVEVKIPDEAK